MSAQRRGEVAAVLAEAGTPVVVDETLVHTALDPSSMPLPFASFASGSITIGSASKSYWAGLRVGWVRVPHDLLPELMRTRRGLDLAASVLDQLTLLRLLVDGPTIDLDKLRRQRDALADTVTQAFPQWRFQLPSGGLSLWCELPEPVATPLVQAADAAGVLTESVTCGCPSPSRNQFCGRRCQSSGGRGGWPRSSGGRSPRPIRPGWSESH